MRMALSCRIANMVIVKGKHNKNGNNASNKSLECSKGREMHLLNLGFRPKLHATIPTRYYIDTRQLSTLLRFYALEASSPKISHFLIITKTFKI